MAESIEEKTTFDKQANLSFLCNWRNLPKKERIESELKRTAYQNPGSVKSNRLFGGGLKLVENIPSDPTGAGIKAKFLFNFTRSLQLLNASYGNDPYIVAGSEFTDATTKGNRALIRIGWLLVQDTTINGISEL